MRRSLWLGSLALLLSTHAPAQESPAIAPGARLRISVRTPTTTEHRSGTVVRAAADTVTLRLDGNGRVAPFARASLERVEVSRGTRSHTGNGLWVGALIGAGTGALVGVAACKADTECSGSSDGDLTPAAAVVGVGLGGVAGLLVGAVVGASIKTDRWEEVPAARWHVVASLGGSGRMGLAVSLPF